MAKLDDRLARAKQFLAIAESDDAAREAYKRAAEEIVAYQEESGESLARLASRVERDPRYVQRVVKWYRDGMKVGTPFLMDEGSSTRAAISHTKSVLSDPVQREKALASLPEKEQVEVARKILSKPKTRQAFADNPKASADLTRASGDVFERTARRTKAEHDTAFPPSGNTGEMLTIVTRTNNARTGVERSLEELKDLVLSQHEADVILEAAERLDAAVDIFVGFMRSGGDGWDTAIAELLEEA